jgi:glucose/arabinose dehydrogenase
MIRVFSSWTGPRPMRLLGLGRRDPRSNGTRRRTGRTCSFEALEARLALATSLPAGFQESALVSGLTTPTSFAFARDGRIFVSEVGGNVRVVSAAGAMQSTSFVTLPYTQTGVDLGLLGLALDPNFGSIAHDHDYVYVYWTSSASSPSYPDSYVVSRFTASAPGSNVAASNSELVLFHTARNGQTAHAGGAIAFGADGQLYFGIGDGDPNGPPLPAGPQSDASYNGKILSINPNVPNPPAVMRAKGLRNPFSATVQPGTSELYVGDVGYESWEEVDHIPATGGGNYGWPFYEGPVGVTGYVDPTYAYSHNGGGAAITGLAFYVGNQFPAEYAGDLIFSDYVTGQIRRLDLATNQASVFATGAATPVDVGVHDGSLYYLSIFSGAIYKITYTPPAASEAPSNLTARAISSSQIDLTWQDNSGNETGFIIMRSTDGVNFQAIATLDPNVTSYSDMTGAPQTRYYYQVVMLDPQGAEPSPTVSAKTKNAHKK